MPQQPKATSLIPRFRKQKIIQKGMGSKYLRSTSQPEAMGSTVTDYASSDVTCYRHLSVREKQLLSYLLPGCPDGQNYYRRADYGVQRADSFA